MTNEIKHAILMLVAAGYTVGKSQTAHAPAAAASPAPVMPDPAAPFGRKLDGTPKLSAAGRPPGSHAAPVAPPVKVAPVAAPAFSLDSLDLGDLGGIGAMTAPVPAKASAPVAPPVKRAAPAAPPVKAAPVKAAAPVAPPTSVEDEILDDLSDLFG